MTLRAIDLDELRECIETCECGARYLYATGHRDGPRHAHRMVESFTDEDWRQLEEALDHGLSWADSEGMGIVDREETMAIVRHIFKRFRVPA